MWFPSQLDLSNYYEAEKNSLDVIIDEVNHKLKTVSLEEQVGLISNAKEEMAKIKGIDSSEMAKNILNNVKRIFGDRYE